MTEAPALAHSDPLNPLRTGGDSISPEAVRPQLERVLNSKTFARSPRISRFLTFVVEQTLEGQQKRLKEYLLGVEVFGRLDSFDPRIDSIVRVEARRLRSKLEKYYEEEGSDDPLYIQFRKGCYIPSFTEKRAGEDGWRGEVSDIPNVRPIHNPEVFTQYVRGRHALAQWSADGVSEAVACFGRALEQDPDCAGAHAGLASAWMLAGFLGLMPARDVVPKARISALRALAIVPDHSEANSITGVADALYNWEWSEAETKLRKAIYANPCDPGARLWYGIYLALCGKPDQGIQQGRRAQQAFPVSSAAHLAVGFACHAGGQYEEALGHYRLAQDVDPNFYAPHFALGLLSTDRGLFGQALDSLHRAAELRPENPFVRVALVYCHSAAGRKVEAGDAFARLTEMAGAGYVAPVMQAAAYSSLGDLDLAFRKLSEAIEERSLWLSAVRFLPVFERLRQDARYEGFTRRIRL